MSYALSIRALLAVTVLLSTTACMYGPYDGKRVSSRTSTINFDGYFLNPSTTITIQAFNFTSGAWENVGSATSGTTASYLLSGVDQPFYRWQASFVLPLAYWSVASSGAGHFARVRSTGGGFNIYPLRKDYAECWAENWTDVNDWLANCPTHRGMEAQVYTNDYQHGPAGCGGVPATTKTRYEVTEISSACQRTAVSDLMAQYIDRSIIDLHYSINHGTSDGFFNGHRRYLRNMQRYLSVYGSKWIPDGRIPFWNPATTIPVELRTVKASPQECTRSTAPGCSIGWDDTPLADPSPNQPKPSSLAPGNICSITDFEDLHHATMPWHNNVHTNTGGVMGNFDSPAAVIFWSWHTFVDMVYSDWQACP